MNSSKGICGVTAKIRKSEMERMEDLKTIGRGKSQMQHPV
jgi:hypothetical protein